jgi:putative GTP pyrophosphokinase
MMTRAELARWYDERRDYHDALTKRIVVTLQDLIEVERLRVVSVRGSTKGKARFLRKASDEKRPLDEIYDISRARVVVFRLSDGEQVLRLLRREFEEVPRPAKSSSTTRDAGYRGTNLILRFSAGRRRFAEYLRFAEAKFEVQIHTAFQHAWAEMQHPRYELSGVLPEGIQQLDTRYKDVSRELDRLDGELDAIANALVEYSAEVRRKAEVAESGESLEIETVAIDSTSLREFLSVHARGTTTLRMNEPIIMRDLVSELEAFGIETIGDLRGLLSAEMMATLDGRFTTVTG